MARPSANWSGGAIASLTLGLTTFPMFAGFVILIERHYEGVGEVFFGLWLMATFASLILGIITLADRRWHARRGRWMAVVAVVLGVGWLVFLLIAESMGSNTVD